MTTVFFLTASLLIRYSYCIKSFHVHWLYPILFLALPFAAGGFHIGTAAVLSLVILLGLVERIHQNKVLYLYFNWNTAAFFLLFLAYTVTPVWGADQGMAAFGFSKYLPLMLYMIFMMQSTEDEQNILSYFLPTAASIMTVASVAFLFVPDGADYVTVNGRLGGFFQYPNSFAAFLLSALILHNSRRIQPCYDVIISILLVTGVILSGSKTVFILMCCTVIFLCLHKRQLKYTVIQCIALVFGICAGLLADQLNLLYQADRFTDIHMVSGTFLARLLYFRDVIPTIAVHPFGLGYMSYPAIEGCIQTGRYYVSFIHNGLLQLLLEVGWVPATFMAVVFLNSILSRKTQMVRKLFLLVLLAHCMLDFDLQFSVFWMIFLSCMDVRSGKMVSVKFTSVASPLAFCLVAVCLWLGCGDWLYRIGRTDACLKLTPFHTEALTYEMSRCDDPEQLDQIADRILELNASNSLAYSAKANAAFSSGDIISMIQYKQKAIYFSPYTTEEYCDYFEKLYTAMQLYLQAGDSDSAAYCRTKLLQIPEMMAAVSEKTHKLAYLTGDDSSLVLPAAYVKILQEIGP